MFSFAVLPFAVCRLPVVCSFVVLRKNPHAVHRLYIIILQTAHYNAYLLIKSCNTALLQLALKHTA